MGDQIRRGKYGYKLVPHQIFLRLGMIIPYFKTKALVNEGFCFNLIRA